MGLGRSVTQTLPIASQTSLLKEAVRSGTIASIVMMPFGFGFKTLGLRVGHYGPKLGEFLFGLQPAPWMQMLLLVQHLLIGWLSAMPLLLFWRWTSPRSPALADGLLYGAFYYLTVNALVLPAIFGDAFPWQLGWSFVYPSLVVHLIFGLSLAVTVHAFHTHPVFIAVNPKGSS
ncbi:hypothetical protein RCH06_003444 [Polaromonas sp. CG_9.5]|nr:hypothetical protein [Polaromonas sp. CG_9.5]